ncbi:zinc finger and BTB domain-containing protein 11-like [Mercenaria mercenaria]|uniref:zinc finger and BTB domain-containing protein 11-like n=1 Tax=Mercenaria mercenaria TaxID=6596 RepID=UPI00234F4396|nr:zinc finger and BTB domain-containing protein 11-like [Mercenaria mercenaria]
MSALRSVLENSTMLDIYTCSVCGMKITLNVLTEHVLLHDQYSAFSYNETTKIIEPLDEIQEQQFQNQTAAPATPPKPYTFLPSSYAFVPAVTYDSAQTSRVSTTEIPVTNQKNSPFDTNNVSPAIAISKSYSLAPHLQNKISKAPLDDLTGIQMIANVAESLGRSEYAETDINGAGGWTDESGKLNISKPLVAGDVIGTIKLPFIENGSIGPACECSIVFNRFVSESKTSAEEPHYEELSLEDIIEDGEEEEEDYGEDYIDSDVPLVKRRRVTLNSTSKGGKYGRKMEVYKYKEPEVANDVQNELQKNIVPELLKDPAVVKYLETMTGKTIEPVNDKETQNVKQEFLDKTEQDATHELYEDDDMVKKTDDVLKQGQNTEEIEKFNSSQGNLTKQPPKEPPVDPVEVSSKNINNDDEESVNENVGNQKEQTRNTIVVKWEQTNADTEKAKDENDLKHSEEVSLSKLEECAVDAYTDHVSELGGSENDDSEQEMMDIESDIHEANTSTENIIDTVSEKQLSLFSFKVEQFVEDIANEVKHKFSDKKNIEEEKDIPSSKDSAENKEREEKNALDDQSLTLEHQLENKFSTANKKLTFCCSICKINVDSFDALRKHFLTHKKHDTEPKKSLKVIDKRLNILSQKVSESLEKSPNNSQLETSSEHLLFYCMLCDIMLPSRQELQEHCKGHKNNGVENEDICKLDGTSASEDTLTADSDIEYASENENKSVTGNGVKKSKSSSIKSAGKLNSKGKSDGLELEARCKVKSTRERTSNMNRKKTIRNDYICENCGAGFLKLEECIAHMNRCEDATVLKCFQGCGYRFKARSELDVHKRFCSRRLAYLERINLEMIKTEHPELGDNDHFETEEENVEKVFNCPFCDQKYQTEEKMIYHKLVCPGRPKQKCDHCDFECKGDKAMGKHLVEKHDLKPFKCQHCPRSFKLKGSLRDHTRYAHTRETFTCEYCGKSFIKQSLYRSHVSIQHQGFRLECSYCGKKFKDKRTWLVHEKSHKGAYDYACALCKKTFNRSEQYRVHMQEVHSIDGKAALSLNSAAKKLRDELCCNVCSICKEKFPLESAYTVHMLKVHGQDGTIPLENL